MAKIKAKVCIFHFPSGIMRQNSSGMVPHHPSDRAGGEAARAWAAQISSHYKGLAAAITERLTLTSCGIFEVLTPESTRVVTEIRTHAGIVRVLRYTFGIG